MSMITKAAGKALALITGSPPAMPRRWARNRARAALSCAAVAA